jgi:hypothetical protein
MEVAGQPTYNECAGGADTDRDSDLVPARPQGKSKTVPLHETEAHPGRIQPAPGEARLLGVTFFSSF